MDRQNPFLILRLPSNATSAEIKRAGQVALASARLQAGDASGDASRLRDVTAAVDALRDPINRFERGLEWPSLGPVATAILRDDPGFADLCSNPTKDRSADLDRMLKVESVTDQLHCRSVFLLLRAQALVEGAVNAAARGDRRSESELIEGSALIVRGLAQWSTVIRAPEFWIAQRLRARELADPRLDPTFITSAQASASTRAIELFTALVQSALRARDHAACRLLIDALRSCESDRETVDAALAKVYEPTCARLDAALKSLQEQLARTKSKSAAPFQALLDRYEKEVGPDIALILAVGDLPGYSEEMARDKSAEFLRSLSVQAANQADAYEVSKTALELAHRAASSRSLQATVANDRKTVAKLMEDTARAKKNEPIATALQAALARDDYSAAVSAIDRLIPLEAPEVVQQLRELRSVLCSNWVGQLCNEALQTARSGDMTRAMLLLEQACNIEPDPSRRAQLRQLISSLPQQMGHRKPSGGCLIPLVIAGGILAGIAALAAPAVARTASALLAHVSSLLEVAP